MAAKTLGIATIQVNGVRLRSMPGATIDIGGVSRAAVVGTDGSVGYSEEIKPAMVSCDVIHDAAFNADFYRNIVDATVLFAADTGQTYLVRGAFSETPPVITAREGGRVPIKLTGAPAEVV